MVPFFKSHYSLLKSILTLDTHKEGQDPDLSDSIVAIAKGAGLTKVTLVEDTMAAFLPANLELRKHGITLVYGYRVSFVTDLEEKESGNSHKNIIFCKNKAGYQTLIKLATKAAYHNFNKEPRLSYADLHEVWDDNNLTLAVPFYDSFLHRNSLYGAMCVPEFRNIKPIMISENNFLPWEYLIQNLIDDFAAKNGLEILKAKSIYYKNREDFETYQTLKCLNRKAYGTGKTLEKPQLNHMGSREFCWESYVDNKRN